MKVAKHPDRAVIIASIDDAGHFSKEQIEQIIASYPAHEREARVKGNPVLGSGRVFPVSEEKIAVPHRSFPSHFARISDGSTRRRPLRWCMIVTLMLSTSPSAID